MGLPASRKNSAIDLGTTALKLAGYKKFAPARMSRQSFLEEMHLANSGSGDKTLDEILDEVEDPPAEFCVHAPEFVDFMGQNDKDYLMLLTNLWDNLDEYTNPKISKKSVKVIKPTINLLGGATPENLNLAFPAASMDTGTLSRFLFVHANPIKDGMLIPEAPSKEATAKIVDRLKRIAKLKGKVEVNSEAMDALEYIYKLSRRNGLQDPRFTYYNGRRMTHLWKLCIVTAAMRESMTITGDDVITANTILSLTEYSMPKALGHFGRSRSSAIMHDISEWLLSRGVPVKTKQIYHRFASDFAKEGDFLSLLQDMQNANRLLSVRKDEEFLGYTVVEDRFPAWQEKLMHLDILTAQELATIGLAKTKPQADLKEVG